MDDNTAETPRRMANRAQEEKRILDGVKDSKQEFGFVPSGTALAIQRLVLTSTKISSTKFGAMWCVRNEEASVYHVCGWNPNLHDWSWHFRSYIHSVLAKYNANAISNEVCLCCSILISHV